MKKQGIIFDMDGTLWDSAANVAESWNEAIRQDGRLNKALTEADIKGVMGKTMDVIAKLLFPEISEKEQETLLAECCRIENDYLREHGGVLYPDLEDTFKELKKTYELYIVSNCQKGYIEAFLDHYHFWDYFSDIECYGNNLLQKGDNIRLLADRNHLDEAVYVGDIQGDYDASRKAGVGFIHAAYGFGIVPEAQYKIQSFFSTVTKRVAEPSRVRIRASSTLMLSIKGNLKCKPGSYTTTLFSASRCTLLKRNMMPRVPSVTTTTLEYNTAAITTIIGSKNLRIS